MVSDCGAIRDVALSHKFAPNLTAAAGLSMTAGTDLYCDGECFGQTTEGCMGIIGRIETWATWKAHGRRGLHGVHRSHGLHAKHRPGSYGTAREA